MKVLAVLGLLGVVGIVVGVVVVKRQFEKYATKSKATEARANVRWMFGLASQYVETCPSPAGTTAEKACLPPAAPPTPPLGACCATSKDCPAIVGDWSHPSWQALEIAPEEPYRYSYEVRSGAGAFTVFAYGDLDCDGVYSTFSMTGRRSADGRIEGDDEPTMVNAEE